MSLLALTSCATPGGPVGTASGQWRDQLHRVPEKLPDGTALVLTTRICRPATNTPARAVIINHATPVSDAERQAMQPDSCTSEAATWFLTRGYVVALPLRRGYGTAAPVADTSGPCAAPNYVRSGLAGAADISAVVDYVTALPYVQPDRAVVLGEATGGWATVAYGSLPHPKVSALISVAGGGGTQTSGPPGQACRADLLAYSAAYFATTDRTPMLWIYAANDSHFSPDTARAMVQSYQAAGGALQYEPVGPYDGNGEQLLLGRGGSAIWGPIIEHYLSTT